MSESKERQGEKLDLKGVMKNIVKIHRFGGFGPMGWMTQLVIQGALIGGKFRKM
jgi:hypothetical protein